MDNSGRRSTSKDSIFAVCQARGAEIPVSVRRTQFAKFASRELFTPRFNERLRTLVPRVPLRRLRSLHSQRRRPLLIRPSCIPELHFTLRPVPPVRSPGRNRRFREENARHTCTPKHVNPGLTVLFRSGTVRRVTRMHSALA